MAKQEALEFHAEPGTLVQFVDANGSTESVEFGKDGTVKTANPLWIEMLERSPMVQSGPAPTNKGGK